MVALTVTVTLSRVITSWRSPVRGGSRMATRCRASKKGGMKIRPGSRTARNWPRRLTTPTKPCWMTLTARNSTITKTTAMAMRTMISGSMSPPWAGRSGWCRLRQERSRRGHRLQRPHQQGGALHCRDGDGDVGIERLRGVGDRQPALAGEHGVARGVGGADGVDGARLLAHQALDAGQGHRLGVPAQGAHQGRPGQQDAEAGDADEGEHLHPGRGTGGRGDRRGEHAQGDEHGEERQRQRLDAEQDDPYDQPEDGHLGWEYTRRSPRHPGGSRLSATVDRLSGSTDPDRALVGVETLPGYHLVEAGAVRRFCEAVRLLHAYYLDVAAAHAGGYPERPGPPTFWCA